MSADVVWSAVMDVGNWLRSLSLGQYEPAFRENEIDTRAYPDVQSVPVELAAGSMVMFGPYLVHQSAPNTSELPRRALLFSYQPPGLEHMIDVQRREREERAAARRARGQAQG